MGSTPALLGNTVSLTTTANDARTHVEAGGAASAGIARLVNNLRRAVNVSMGRGGVQAGFEVDLVRERVPVADAVPLLAASDAQWHRGGSGARRKALQHSSSATRLI